MAPQDFESNFEDVNNKESLNHHSARGLKWHNTTDRVLCVRINGSGSLSLPPWSQAATVQRCKGLCQGKGGVMKRIWDSQYVKILT